MQVRERKINTSASCLNRRTVLCAVALALAESRPLREQMEQRRIIHANETPVAIKQELGQYFTPGHIADFMASLFPKNGRGEVRILDPGAGIGILSCALAERIAAEHWDVSSLAVEAFEIDPSLVGQLQENLEKALSKIGGRTEVVNGDFLAAVAESVKRGESSRYTHVIMNPPYKKIRSASKERELVQSFGLETVNLYTAFMGASIVSTVDDGYIVAIVPRSFCNGTYYKPFREFLLKRCSIERIHLFDSRNTAFKDEAVLQENIIIMLRKGGAQGDVTVSYSRDASLKDLESRTFPFAEIVSPGDGEQYINIPQAQRNESDSGFEECHTSLRDIGIQASTGAVVDFRVKDTLRKEPEDAAVPLLYSVHFKDWRVRWPMESKRPNAIVRTSDTEKMLLPRGHYVAVKRFSAKEEKRRLVASLVRPEDFKADSIAFENHLNVFMQDKHGLDKYTAYGLVAWLNTTWLDEKFRVFSGHTQVNATDLRNLPYPSAKQLSNMGRKVESEQEWSQAAFDRIAKEVVKAYKTRTWRRKLAAFKKSVSTLVEQYAQERQMDMVQVRVRDGLAVSLSSGKHNELIRLIIEDMAPRFMPGATLVYIGDTGDKWGFFDKELAAQLGLNVDEHGKMPDVVLWYEDKNWLVLVESVTSHGPVDSKRHIELKTLFASTSADSVYISAFPDKRTFARFASDVAWETEVWVADNPTHMVHFNGSRFLGPYA